MDVYATHDTGITTVTKHPSVDARYRRHQVDKDTKIKWEGRWDQLKGKAQQTWGDLTDDDVAVGDGEWDELVGRIKERTGETVERIRERLGSLDD